MARRDDMAASVGRYLRKSESVLGATRATVRGTAITTALFAGAGAAVGYTVSTFVSDGALAAALGGGAGGAAGMLLAIVAAYVRMRRRTGLRAAAVTLVLTRKRLLAFRQSWLANRAVELAAEYAVSDIASVEVGPSRLLSPHAVDIAFTDGTVLALESARIEDPVAFGVAFAALDAG